jgi:hypothetical protein
MSVFHAGSPSAMMSGMAWLRRRGRDQSVSAGDAMVTVYRRPDGYYVVTSSRTTAGLWIYAGSAMVVGLTAGYAALGDVVAAAVASPGEIVPHPRQDQWTEQRRRSLGPLMRQAGVSSWKAFLAPATVASVHRDGRSVAVTPLRRDEKRTDVFHEAADRQVELHDVAPADVGRVVAAALDPRVSAGPGD